MTTPLEERIRQAFAGNRYPGDDRLTVYGSDENQETFKLLRGKTWQEMPVVKFMLGDTPIPDLSPVAFHYYMPALLIASLKEFPDASVSITVFLTPSLFAPISAELVAECEQRLTLFTPEQRDVIKDTLRQYVVEGWLDVESVDEAIQWIDRAASA